MKKILLKPFAALFLLFLLLSIEGVWGQGQQVLSGSGSFTVPCGVTSITVQVIGGGGGGGRSSNNNQGGTGGSGGGFAQATIPVSSGQSFTYVVGAGGVGQTGNPAATNGGTSNFGGVGFISASGGGAGIENMGAQGAVGTGTVGAAGATNVITASGAVGQIGTATFGGAGGNSGAGSGGAAQTINDNNGSLGTLGGGGAGGFSTSSPANDGGNGGVGSIIVYWTPVSAGVSEILPTCSTSFNLNANPAPSGFTGTWVAAPSGPIIQSPNNANSNVTNLTLGQTYTFRWTISGIGCNSSYSEVIIISSLPIANAGPDVSLCQPTFNMTANTPETGFNGSWSCISGCTGISASPVNSPTATVGNLINNQTTVMRWTVTNGTCTRSDDVQIRWPVVCNDDPCGAISIPTNGCAASGTTFVGSTTTQNPGQPGCGGFTYYGGNKIDVWFTATTDANGNLNLTLAGNQNLNAAIYTGTCTNLTQFSCHGWNNTINPLTIQETNLPPNATVYIRVWKLASEGGTFTICQTASGNNSQVQPGNTTINCGGSMTFYDSGGSGGNHGDNELTTWVLCPNGPGQFVRVTFSSVSLETNLDQLIVLDGNNSAAQVIGAVPNTAGGVTYTAGNSTGCLTFIFRSDISVTNPGWAATVTCVPTQATNTYQVCNEQNCLSGCMRTLCSLNTSVSFQGNGFGTQELNFGNNGCMDSGERCSNWFLLNPTSPGTISLNMLVNSGQNQDFAVWKSFGNTLQCPAFSGQNPLLCNIAPATSQGTGFNDALATVNVAYEPSIVVTQNDINNDAYYIMQVQTWSNGNSCPQPNVTLTFGGTAGLSCDAPVVLPVELIGLKGEHLDRYNRLYWSTETEFNSSHFNIESSKDGMNWISLGKVPAAGNSNNTIQYSFDDYSYHSPLTYYRIQMVDKDGSHKTSEQIVVLTNQNFSGLFSHLFPNPAKETYFFNYGGKDFDTAIEISMFNSNGSLVKTQVVDSFDAHNAIKINCDNLANGIYQVIIQQGENMEMKKMSIIR